MKHVLKAHSTTNNVLTRRDNIRIYNVPENEEGDSTISFVEKLLRENLATELHIVTTQRALAPKPASTERPRSRVINFTTMKQKRIFYTKHGLQKTHNGE